MWQIFSGPQMTQIFPDDSTCFAKGVGLFHMVRLWPHGIWALLCLGFMAICMSGCIPGPKGLPPDREPPGPCEKTLSLAEKCAHERRYEKALGLINDPAFSCRDTVKTCLMRGDILYALEDMAGAEAAYENVLESEPKNPEAVVRLWFIHAIRKGFTTAAKNELRKTALAYLETDPGDPKVVYGAFLGLEGSRAVLEKTELVEKYIPLVQNPLWRKHIAEIYFYDTFRVDKAERTNRARFFINTFGRNRYRYNMTQILLSAHKSEGAVAVRDECRRILEREPKNRVLNYLCAKALLEVNGDLLLAESCIKQAVQSAKDPDPEDRYPYVDDDTWEELMAAARAAYHATLGRIKHLQGNKKTALRRFKKGLHHHTRCHKLHFWYAETLASLGKYDKALTHYKKAAVLNISDDAEKGMSRILKSRGIHTPARDYFAGAAGIPRFTDATKKAGLSQITGKRVAWSDLNGDGFPDLIVAGRKVLQNNGDGTFTDVTEASGLSHDFPSGGICADFDGNGRPDLMAFTTKNGPRLYLNRSEHSAHIRFADTTASALPPWPENNPQTEAAAAADVDGNGTVDVYLANYEKKGPERGLGTADRLYLNMGGGRFEDAPNRLTPASKEPMCGRGVAFADYNNDGRQDLFVANYRLDPDFLYINRPQGNGKGFLLVDQAEKEGVRGHNVSGAYGHSIGGAWGYFEKDRPALFVAALAHPHLLGLSDISTLYLPVKGTPSFERHFRDMGFFYEETHADPSFVDVDLDGDLDLFLTSVYKGRTSFLYLNQNGKFVDATWTTGVRILNGWGAAWADFDRDGDLDLAVCADHCLKLLKNEAQSFHRNWLAVKVRGVQSPGTGIGTKIMVRSRSMKTPLIREIQAGRGTGNQDEAIAHFGFGHDQGPFLVTVRFPSGKKVVRRETRCRRMIEVKESDPVE